jgi:hypothetical protein
MWNEINHHNQFYERACISAVIFRNEHASAREKAWEEQTRGCCSTIPAPAGTSLLHHLPAHRPSRAALSAGSGARLPSMARRWTGREQKLLTSCYELLISRYELIISRFGLFFVPKLLLLISYFLLILVGQFVTSG